MNIVIITGLSGSGKTTALHAFEDRGFFCVDNLPVNMIPGLVENVKASGSKVHDLVFGIDCRERDFLDGFINIKKDLGDAGHDIEVIYLESRDDVLVRRFSATRRRHPLLEGDIFSALKEEKEVLKELRENATRIIDTSNLNVHELKQVIFSGINETNAQKVLSVSLLSFGFKNGVPLEADLMFDVRFLPNPYFEENLKYKTGLDQDVYDFVMSYDESKEMFSKIKDMIDFTLPLFEREGKLHLTIAVGCTGGRHRSISMIRSLEEYMSKEKSEYKVLVRHRDYKP